MAKTTVPVTPPEAPEQGQSNVVVSAGGAAKQNTLRNIGLIINREFRNRVAQRSFVISTVILMVLLVIVACIPTLIAFIVSKTNSQTRVAVVNNAGTIANLSETQLISYMDATLNGASAQGNTSSSGKPAFTIQSSTGDQVENLRQKVKNGDLEVLLVIERASDQNLQFTYYTHENVAQDDHVSQIQALAGQVSVLDKSARLGLTPEQTSSLFAPPTFNTVSTQEGERSSADQVAGYFVAYAGVLLIFMSVFIYGMGVATGAAEEKGSRIMEILVNAATPFQLMVGKILGIGAAGLTQMVCLVAVGISALLLQAPLQNALLGTSTPLGLGFSITGVAIMMLLLVLLYFILGFLLYATLFAALGALVKRQDEVQNVTQPLTWLFMIGYIVSFAAGTAADQVWVKVISFVPFWTPTVMLMRIGSGSVAWWEIPLSVILMAIFIFLCALLSARIYRFAVLMYGQRPKLGQLFRVIRTD